MGVGRDRDQQHIAEEQRRTHRGGFVALDLHRVAADPAKTAPSLVVDDSPQLVSLTLGSDHHQHMETD